MRRWSTSRAAPVRVEQTDDAFAAAGVPHAVRFEVNLMELVERFVRHGLAVGIVPASIADGFEGVVRIPLQPTPTRRVHLVWQRLPACGRARLRRGGAQPRRRRLRPLRKLRSIWSRQRR